MNRELNGDRGLVLVKGYSGLADRMKALVEAIAFAELTDRRLAVAWQDEAYSDDGDDVFFRYFQSDTLEPWPAVMPTGGVHPDSWAGVLDRSINEIRKPRRWYPRGRNEHSKFIDTYQLDASFYDGDAPVVVVFKGGRVKNDVMERLSDLAAHRGVPPEALRPSIQKQDYLGLVREIMADHVRLHPVILAELERFKKEHLDGPVIGLHIRYTDRICNLSKALTAIDRARSEQPNSTIFLATDSEPVAAMITRRYDGVITREITRSRSVDSLHHWSEPTGKAFLGGVDALLDMYLLASCNTLLFCHDQGFASFSAAMSLTDEANKISYQEPRDAILTKHEKLGDRLMVTATVLVPVIGPLPKRCLNELSRQDYPENGLEIAVFGEMNREMIAELNRKWPHIRVLSNQACRVEDVVDELNSKIIAVTNPNRRHRKTWLKSRVNQLITTPLCALLHDDANPNEIVILTTVLHDPSLNKLPLELKPTSLWGQAAVNLGYRHTEITPH